MFQPGHKLSKGRKPGTVTVRRFRFEEIMAKNNFCPATALMEIYAEAKKVYDNYGTIYAALEQAREAKGMDIRPTEDKSDKYLKIALDAAKDLAGYAYPKLKAIEQTPNRVTDGMTPEQKLEAMKQYVAALEAQIKK